MTIRKATVEDVPRIAEILVFSKRKNYRNIFNNDVGSFVDLQVYSLAKMYFDKPELLENYFVYDDEFVLDENERAKRFYSKHGFSETNQVREAPEALGSKIFERKMIIGCVS